MMDLSTARALFADFEQARDTELESDPPVYDVRLDARTDESGGRYFTVRVTASRGSGGFTRDTLLYVLEQCGERDIDQVDVENNGVVIGG